MLKALVILANGPEDIETISVTDILTRGGIKVTVAALSDSSTEITTAHGMVFKAGKLLKDVDDTYDIIVVPGGYDGSMNCRNSDLVGRMLREQKERGGVIGAICAAPGFVLTKHGILDDSTPATGYPGTTKDIPLPVSDKDVVIDPANKIITAKGPAFAAKFAFAILAVLKNRETAEKVAGDMLYVENMLD